MSCDVPCAEELCQGHTAQGYGQDMEVSSRGLSVTLSEGTEEGREGLRDWVVTGVPSRTEGGAVP